MVFCGKPSKGCATCRAKKKKCDEAVPACSLCKRTGVTCPGYRDQLLLSFRDESQHILRKISRSSQKKTSQKKTPSVDEPLQQSKPSPAPDFTNLVLGLNSPNHEDFDGRRGSSASAFEYIDVGSALSAPHFDLSHDFDRSSNIDLLLNIQCSSRTLEILPASEFRRTSYKNMYSPTISTHLSPSLEDQATCFFFQNYVFTELATPYGHFARLSTIFGQAKETKALSGVIISIGAAGISNIRKNPKLMHAAQEIHSTTLQRTQNLLEDSNRIQEDQTLLVVLLLALYENITCCAPQSMRSWSRHVRGATALLSLRSQDALNDIPLLELFLHLRQQAITDCLQRRVSVPQIIADWSHNAKNVKNVVSEHRLWQNPLEEISIRLCQLRSSIKQGNIDDFEAISQALSIDEALEGWLSDIPAEYSYTKFYDFESPDDVFLGCYHVYPETRVAIVWNHYRSLRIITNEVIVDALNSRGSVSSHDAQRLASEQLFKKLTADVCASVPPFLGYRNGQKNAPVVIGTLLLWPLYTCAAQNYVSPITRDWVILQFDRIGENTGIRLATYLARVLRTKGEVTVWDKIDATDGQNLVQQVEWDNLEEW